MPPRLALRTAVAAAALFASAGAARADIVEFTGSKISGSGSTADLVSFSGRFELTGTTTKVLTITLTNTTPATFRNGNTTVVNGADDVGYITGFGFNLPNNVTASLQSRSDADFRLLNSRQHATSLQSSNEFDYAFSTNAGQLHTVAAGEIALGLAAGQTATFSVTLGNAPAGLTALQLINERNGGNERLSVRFRTTDPVLYRGSTTPDGDKVEINSVTPIPAPPGVVLAGIGFGGLLLGRLRRRA